MKKAVAIGALSALAQETRLDIFRMLVRAGLEGIPAGVLGEPGDGRTLPKDAEILSAVLGPASILRVADRWPSFPPSLP
jgi:hypothetical protein